MVKHNDMNDTMHAETHDESDVVAWIVVPVLLGVLIYATLALFVWPYARPVVSPWLLVLCILLPPLFPFLLVFVLFSLCFVPPVVVSTRDVYVVETRGRVRPAAPPRVQGGRRMPSV